MSKKRKPSCIDDTTPVLSTEAASLAPVAETISQSADSASATSAPVSALPSHPRSRSGDCISSVIVGSVPSSTATSLILPLEEQFPSSKRARLSESGACSIDGLADVELQLCLQWLRNGEKLKCARVSRRMLHAVQQPFSWRGASLFVISSNDSKKFARVSASLIRLAPIDFFYNFKLSNAELALLPPLHRIRLTGGWSGSPPEWEELFQLPAVQNVVEFRADIFVPIFQPLATLQKLRSVSVFYGYHPCGSFEPLSRLPQLTELSVTSVWPEAIVDIALCSHLCKLYMNSCPIFAMRNLLNLPSLATLEELSLSSLDSIAISSKDWISIWTNLVCLRILTLNWIYHLDVLLADLRSAASLRLLKLILESNPDHELTVWPSRKTLEEVLAAAPKLHVLLQCRVGGRKAATAHFREMADPPRMTVVEIEAGEEDFASRFL
jgi:hypothetical protein